jgi:hypothetical protein
VTILSYACGILIGYVAGVAVVVVVREIVRAFRHNPHRYLSTGCLHGHHGDCQTQAVRYDGTPKIAASCKWCHAPCICRCHRGRASAT